MSALTLGLYATGSLLYVGSIVLPTRLGLAVAFSAALTVCAASILDGSWIWTVLHASLAAVFGWMWWRRGGGGRTKKAVKELGAKSKARVRALVANLKPSPVPAPGGAR